MTVALANLKWVLGSLLENDRQFQYYSKCADLSNVAAKRDGDVVKIRFEFGDENSYDGVLKFAKNEAEVLFYKTYSIQSDFPLPRYVSSHKNMLLIQNMEPYGVTNTTYLGLKKQQVFNLAIHLSDLHAFHLLSHSNTSLWLPEERPITVDEFQLAVSDVDSVLSSGDVSSLCSYLKLHQSTSKKEDLKPVCVHGNFTTDVIFWEKDEEGDPKNIVAAVVGWNGVHLGSPTDDLAQLLITCTDPDERLLIQNDCVELYYNSLRSQISASNELMNCFTLDKVYKSFKRSFIVQSIKYIMTLQRIMKHLETRKSQRVAEAVKGKLRMRAKFAVMETLGYIKAMG